MGPFRDGWTIQDINEVVDRGDPRELLYVPIVISLDPADCRWAESICLRLSTHPDESVRGNAILGFGHIARTCRCLDEAVVKPIIAAALQDSSASVRGQADAAADDMEHFLGWRIDRG